MTESRLNDLALKALHPKRLFELSTDDLTQNMYFKHKIKLYVVFCIFKLNYRESVLFLSDQNQIEICSEFADEILDSTE